MALKWMVITVASLLAGQTGAFAAQELRTELEKTSYAVGADLGKNIQRQGITFDVEALLGGMRDALAHGDLRMTDAELQATLNAFQTDLKLKRARPLQLVATKNKADGDAFLAANKAKEGVVTLPSGVQYKILKEGQGRKPSAGDTVECHYRGTLIDGAEFDNSYRRGQPATLPVKGVVPGFGEALQLMAEGSKWQVVLPSQCAYGEKGSGSKIEPYATLIFEIELLSIK